MLRAFDVYEQWKRGRDTLRIAELFNVKESEVYNMLTQARYLGKDITAIPLGERAGLFGEMWK